MSDELRYCGFCVHQWNAEDFCEKKQAVIDCSDIACEDYEDLEIEFPEAERTAGR